MILSLKEIAGTFMSLNLEHNTSDRTLKETAVLSSVSEQADLAPFAISDHESVKNEFNMVAVTCDHRKKSHRFFPDSW